MSSLTLRARIAITSALAVALALMLSAGIVYASTARSLQAGIDQELQQAAQIVEREAEIVRLTYRLFMRQNDLGHCKISGRIRHPNTRWKEEVAGFNGKLNLNERKIQRRCTAAKVFHCRLSK